ncbi:MAG: thioredoxin family protein [Clostridium sp.]|nr:thioredoxin family protein [Clostridium sp.]
MKKTTSSIEIKDIIEQNRISVVYFTGMDCGACEAIKFKIEEILKRFNNIKSCEVDGEKHPDICAEYGVFSVPIFLLFIDRKESIRIGRNVDLMDLESKIQRYYEMVFE